MNRAEAYLQKAALRGRLIQQEPLSGCRIIACIPVYNESGLERCLDSLFIAAGPTEIPSNEIPPTEVLILINAPGDAPKEVLEQNQRTLEETRTWIAAHPHPRIRFHVWLDHSFSRKEAGVGTARKILMDEAVRRAPNSIISSLDADVVVAPNYLEALNRHFFSLDSQAPEGCSIRFEHPLGPEDPQGTDASQLCADPADPAQCQIYPPRTYRAIALYELHLRYYLQSVRSTGYPHAFNTVGSAFALRTDIYCQEGGMNRRQGGEDFYFIQKVAQRGGWSECNETCVYPSPRPSDRVPFGTGPVVKRLLGQMKQPDQTEQSGTPEKSSSKATLNTYHPEPFRILRDFFMGIDGMYLNDPGIGQEPLPSFLEQQGFPAALHEIRQNSASISAFRKRFWRWFNMFRIMKFLHHARENGYPDIPVVEASQEILLESAVFSRSEDAAIVTVTGLLRIFRDGNF